MWNSAGGQILIRLPHMREQADRRQRRRLQTLVYSSSSSRSDTRWNAVRLAFAVAGVPEGGTRFQKSTKSFDAVTPSNTASGVPAPWQLTTRMPWLPSLY